MTGRLVGWILGCTALSRCGLSGVRSLCLQQREPDTSNDGIAHVGTDVILFQRRDVDVLNNARYSAPAMYREDLVEKRSRVRHVVR